MNTDAHYIKRAFGHKLVGNRFMKKMVAEALSGLPGKIVLFVTKYCWFVSSLTDSWAFTVRDSDLKRGEYLIFLSDELLNQSEWQIRHTILHEVGHVVLGHRNSIGEIQSKAEIRRQEKEADRFAKEYN
jgi:Zn-dependent protease with chaperone function